MCVHKVDIITRPGFFDEIASKDLAVTKQPREVTIELVIDRQIKFCADFIVDAAR